MTIAMPVYGTPILDENQIDRMTSGNAEADHILPSRLQGLGLGVNGEGGGLFN